MKNNKPKWKNAPPWARWLAQNKNGVWWWFEKKPTANDSEIHGRIWEIEHTDKFFLAGFGEPSEKWKDTLEMKPINKKDN